MRGVGLEGGDSTVDSSLVVRGSKISGDEMNSRNRVLGDLARGSEGPGTGVISWIGRSEGREGGVKEEKGGRNSTLSESELAWWAFFEVEAFGEFVRDLWLFFYGDPFLFAELF
jgi:hypothetical protein